MEETASPKTIKIGKASVGLVGLDAAFNRILADTSMTEENAVEFLFEEVQKQNYVPPQATELYRKALRREYRRRTGKEADRTGGLVIRVLGPGCVSCNRLTTMLIEVLQKYNLAADIESVHELDDIWRYGVLNTPALVINNEVKCSGRLPTLAQIEEWIKEITER